MNLLVPNLEKIFALFHCSTSDDIPIICLRIRAEREEQSQRGLTTKAPKSRDTARLSRTSGLDEAQFVERFWFGILFRDQVDRAEKVRDPIIRSSLSLLQPQRSPHHNAPSQAYRPQRSIIVPDYMQCTTPFFHSLFCAPVASISLTTAHPLLFAGIAEAMGLRTSSSARHSGALVHAPSPTAGRDQSGNASTVAQFARPGCPARTCEHAR